MAPWAVRLEGGFGSYRCLHNNTIVVRGILVTTLHCGAPEPRLSTIYIKFVSSVGTSFKTNKHQRKHIQKMFFNKYTLNIILRHPSQFVNPILS